MISHRAGGQTDLATVRKVEKGEDVVEQLRRQLKQVAFGSQSHCGGDAWTTDPELGYRTSQHLICDLKPLQYYFGGERNR